MTIKHELLQARGLSGAWLNGWLASVGATVLVDDLRVQWSSSDPPYAILSTAGNRDVVEAIAAALPDDGWHRTLAARNVMNSSSAVQSDGSIKENKDRFPRNPTLQQYQAAAALSRRHWRDHSVSSTVSDVGNGKEGLPHSRFDPPVPKGLTLWDRLGSCVSAIHKDKDSLIDRVANSIAGRGARVEGNGLGFDVRRLVATGDKTDVTMDPIIEVLVFFGLALFPMGADGSARGWQRYDQRRNSFRWCTWDEPLDRWGIDALLGLSYGDRSGRLPINGSVYESVSYRPKGSSDTTRAFASKEVLPNKHRANAAGVRDG